jgi:hypothetical protein
MTKYKDLEEKIDEALDLSKKTGKEHIFNLCKSGAGIISSKIEEVSKEFPRDENKCLGMKLGSFETHPESNAIQSPTNIQPDIQKV